MYRTRLSLVYTCACTPVTRNKTFKPRTRQITYRGLSRIFIPIILKTALIKLQNARNTRLIRGCPDFLRNDQSMKSFCNNLIRSARKVFNRVMGKQFRSLV